MDLNEAIARHAEWKLKFRSAIAGKERLDASSIAKDNCCQLGQWLYGDGKRAHGARPQFQTLLDRHRNFHATAGKVADLINAAKYVQAEAAIAGGTPYASASSDVGVAIIGLKKAAGL